MSERKTSAMLPVRNLLGGVPKPHGQSIKTPRKHSEQYPYPNFVTVMAIQVTPEFEFRFRTLRMPVGTIDDVQMVEKELLMASRQEHYSRLIDRISDTIDGVDFKDPSWFTIVLDTDNWDFCHDGRFSNYDQFIFYDVKAEIVSGTLESKNMDENWSFFNAKPVIVTDDNGVKRKAVRCINYCKRPNATGEDLPSGDYSPFGFNIYMNVPLARRFVEEPRVIVIIDPTGENKGPP